MVQPRYVSCLINIFVAHLIHRAENHSLAIAINDHEYSTAIVCVCVLRLRSLLVWPVVDIVNKRHGIAHCLAWKRNESSGKTKKVTPNRCSWQRNPWMNWPMLTCCAFSIHSRCKFQHQIIGSSRFIRVSDCECHHQGPARAKQACTRRLVM